MKPAFFIKPREYLKTPERKRILNEALFSALAQKYGIINRILSLNRDQAWKRRLIHELPIHASPVCVDLACGTGDLTLLLAKKYPQGRIIGLDLTEPMLAIARARCPFAHVEFVRGDMGNTQLKSESVDVLTGGYALRNSADLPEVVHEIHHLLKPGAIASFLDFSKPSNRVLQEIEYFLLRTWGGFWGFMMHRNPDLYTYIADSLQQHPDRRQLHDLFKAADFDFMRTHLYYGGILEAFSVRKKAS
jgi:ubiquinone/menaquinone biosynthesis methyltransferase